MKKPTNAIALLAMLLLFQLSAWSQGGTTHTITLEVNTATISSLDVDGSSSFGQDGTIPNRDFTIEVSPGDIIVWEAVSTNAQGTDEVRLITVNKDSGSDLFGSNTLREDNANPGTIRAVVESGNPGDVLKYSIKFKVFNDGKKKGTFVIDPKIQIKG